MQSTVELMEKLVVGLKKGTFVLDKVSGYKIVFVIKVYSFCENKQTL